MLTTCRAASSSYIETSPLHAPVCVFKFKNRIIQKSDTITIVTIDIYNQRSGMKEFQIVYNSYAYTNILVNSIVITTGCRER
jgi:hypothetical protein